MPVYRSRTVLGITRKLTAFVDLDLGLVRAGIAELDEAEGELTSLRQEVVGLRRRLAERDRQLSEAGERDAIRAGRRVPVTGAGPASDGPTTDTGERFEGDPRDHLIARVARDRTFADVGGLYGTVNEKVSVAHRHGARGLAMIDIDREGGEPWTAFSERMRDLDVPGCELISGDIIELAESADHPTFDVVHCTGVLYHMPDPVRLVAALHRITARYLILGSAVTPTEVTRDGESVVLPSAGAIFVPALEGRERAVLEHHWRPIVADAALGLTRDVETWDVTDYAPWWWLPTVNAVRGVCESAGFRYEDGALYWNDHAYVMLLSRR